MCMVEDADGWTVFSDDHPVARRPHRCGECYRNIEPGERYYVATGLIDSEWLTMCMCAHCEAAAQWLSQVCNGYVFGEVYGELRTHWHDGYASIPLGRLIGGMRYQWADGRMPVPDWATELGRADFARSGEAA